EIVEQGRAQELLRAPQHPYTRNLLGSQVNSGQQRIPRRILSYQQQPEAHWLLPKKRDEAEGATPLLELKGIDVRYGTSRFFDRLRSIDRTFRATKGINLSIAPGETIGLVGESGCGKSSLAKTVA